MKSHQSSDPTDSHVDLTDIAIELGIAPKVLRTDVTSRGINPILPKSAPNRFVYRCADI